MKQSDKLFIAFSVLAVLVIGGVITYKVLSNKSVIASTSQTPSTKTSTSTVSTPSSAATTSPQATTSSLKDGTYSATTEYSVPHGNSNTLTTKITISNGKINDVSTNDQYSDRESGIYIDDFESSLKSSVVGKSLDNISSSRIGGASLTSDAFYETLDTIATNAKA